MAIVSKENRAGVDVAIEAIQQKMYPNLLGYWDGSTTYTMYPRANKNYKGDDIKPEISLDKKDYEETLFNDKVFVNSFFLVNNDSVYDTSERLSTQSISIIFQADLVKLYGDTERVDEVFNNNVLAVLDLVKKRTKYLTGDITVTRGFDAVYSDLTFTAAFKDQIKYSDISNRHIVKFTFDVVYGLGCENVVTPVCAPVAIFENMVNVANPASGESYYYTTGCDPSTVNVNGDLLGTVLSGDTLNVVVKYENGTPTGTIVSGEVIIDNPVEQVRIYNQPAYSGAADRDQDYDTYWRMINNIGNYTQPMKGVAMRLAWGKYYMLHPDITIGNIFGNQQRWTGDEGGYFDWDTWYSSGKVTENYYDVDNVLTTRELAFPNGLAVDHWIGGVVPIDGYSTTDSYTNQLNYGATLTIGSFTGFYALSVPEAVTFGTWGDITFPYRDSPLFDWGTLAKFLGDSYPASGTGNAMVIQTYGHITSTPKANANRVVFYKPIDINATFGS